MDPQPSATPGPPPRESAYGHYAGAWQPGRGSDQRPPRPRSILGLLGVAVWLVAMGVLTVFGVAEPAPGVILGITLLVIGGTLLVGTLFGRARKLIGVGVLAAVLLVPTTVLQSSGIDLRGGVGERRDVPQAVEDIPEAYRLALGQQIIDLTELDLERQTARVEVSLGVGELVVRVPDDVVVEVTGHMAAGDVDLFGDRTDGTDLTLDAQLDNPEGAGRILLDISVVLGEVTVEAVDLSRASTD